MTPADAEGRGELAEGDRAVDEQSAVVESVKAAFDRQLRDAWGGSFATPDSEVDRLARRALKSAIEAHIADPEFQRAIEAAVRNQAMGSGFKALRFGGSGWDGLDSIARDALKRELSRRIGEAENQAAIDASLTSQTMGSGLRALTLLSTGSGRPGLDSMSRDALAREMKRRLSAEESEDLFVRRNALRLGSDPALRVELTRDEASERETNADEDESGHVEFGALSRDFTSPADLFASSEIPVRSFADLMDGIQNLSANFPSLRLVWRGHQNATWGLHSSLYRRLQKNCEVLDDSSRRCPLPSEDAMVAAEKIILRESEEWRMTDLPALEFFARLQHQGGPTRLIDVTQNPLIAAWFAVEAGSDEEVDGRLFGIATQSVAASNRPRVSAAQIEPVLSGRYSSPFWFYTRSERRQAAWGTGEIRRIWRAPVYDKRISAQNAAFLLEGVPTFTEEARSLFERPDGSLWGIADIAHSTSVYAHPVHPDQVTEAESTEVAPLFSFRISAGAKPEIRRMLTRTFGLTESLLYPDVQALSLRLRREDWLPVLSHDSTGAELS